jgi:hypothetical protein
MECAVSTVRKALLSGQVWCSLGIGVGLVAWGLGDGLPLIGNVKIFPELLVALMRPALLP